MPKEASKEVIDILSMFSALTFSYRNLSDKTGIEEWKITFNGFDGNNEGDYLAYAKFFMHELDRFEELQKPMEITTPMPLHYPAIEQC